MISNQKLEANKRNSLLAIPIIKSIAENRKQSYIGIPCKFCTNPIPYEKKGNKFCTQYCAAKYNSPKIVKVQPYKCGYCENKIKRGKFCSSACSGLSRVKTPEHHRRRRNEASANYRAKERNQTPPEADRKAITEFYKACPEGYEVDHIIPISKGGLHILENLQYLTANENRRKGNKMVGAVGFEPTVPVL